MLKRFLSIALSLGFILSLAVSLVSSHLTPASAHSGVSSHASTVDVAAKKKHHHYHGVKVPTIQENDVGSPTTFTVVGKGLTPSGFYDVNLTDFLDRCSGPVFTVGTLADAEATLGGELVPADDEATFDFPDIKADTEGRASFTVLLPISDCPSGVYSITLVNEAHSGEFHEAHFHIKAA